jgi:hypothetical protein
MASEIPHRNHGVLEQQGSKAQDADRNGDDKAAAELPELKRTLKYFEARLNGKK